MLTLQAGSPLHSGTTSNASRCPQPFHAASAMIFLSRSWHGCISMDDLDTTIATIADIITSTGEGFLSAAFRGETSACRVPNSIRLECGQ
jgi:hypothetical protein